MKSRLLGKVVFAAFVVMMFLFVVQQPLQASETFKGVAGWLSSAANSFGVFVGNL